MMSEGKTTYSHPDLDEPFEPPNQEHVAGWPATESTLEPDELSHGADVDALAAIIRALEPFHNADRGRIFDAAGVFFGIRGVVE